MRADFASCGSLAAMAVVPFPPATVGARVTTTCVALVVGLAVGSFLNVVVYRVPRGLSVVKPGSFCPSCLTPLGARDNIPVLSWLALHGKCRHCAAPISRKYPAVEATTAATFGVLALVMGPHWAVPGILVLTGTLMALVSAELDEQPGGRQDGTQARQDGTQARRGVTQQEYLPIAVVGSAIGLAALAVGAGADGTWWRLAGASIGLAAAFAILAAGATTTAALLPAGTTLGWFGAGGAAVGIAAALVAVLLARRIRARVRLGASAALAAGILASFVVVVATGTNPGR